MKNQATQFQATRIGDPLTPRQEEILNTIRSHIRDHGYPPTVREIGSAHGITSPNGVITHLKALMKKGFIEHDANKSRGIRIIGQAGICPNCGARLPQ